jgi:hypothetical protein
MAFNPYQGFRNLTSRYAPTDPLEEELQTQGGPPSDSRWTDGTWGTGDPYLPTDTAGGYEESGGSGSSPNPWDYEAAQRDWMGGPWDISNPDAARQSAQSWASKWGATYGGDDFVTLPNGAQLDIIHNLKSGQNMMRGWTGLGQYANPGSGGGGSTSVGGMAAGGGGYSDPRIKDAIYKLLEDGFKPVDPNSADFRARYRPVANQMQRGAQRSKDAAAERMAFQGMNIGGAGGALDAEANKINESLALGEGGLTAQLVTDDLEAQREKIYNALQFAQGEERMALQMMLSQMDNELRRYGMDQQNQQFYDDFGYRVGRDEYLFNSDYWS